MIVLLFYIAYMTVSRDYTLPIINTLAYGISMSCGCRLTLRSRHVVQAVVLRCRLIPLGAKVRGVPGGLGNIVAVYDPGIR